MNTALDHFPIGNAGQDGAHALEPSALNLSGFCCGHDDTFQKVTPTRHAIPLLTAVLLVSSAKLIAQSHPDTTWEVLGGPEKEKAEAVQIVEGTGENLEVLVAGRRGTVMRRFPETSLPAKLTFRFQSSYDPKAREVPTELFGTGDFRIFVGIRGRAEEKAELSGHEGFQFRIFPHLSDSPNRVFTDDEAHAATSLCIWRTDPRRRLDGMGLSHTGLLSAAGQNRNKQMRIHNAGGARIGLLERGFALKNAQEAAVTIRLTQQAMSTEEKERPLPIHSGLRSAESRKSTLLPLLTPTLVAAIRPVVSQP